MNFRAEHMLFPLFMVALIFLSACSSSEDASSSSYLDSTTLTNSVAAAAEQGEEGSASDQARAPNNSDSHSPEEMVAFHGTVFVATSELVTNLWQSAGWQIGNQPIDTDADNIPVDCTLYPHLGVVDQWVGSCAGNVLIPKKGAEHIAVIVTDNNGAATMIQVAPDSGNQRP